MRSRSYEVYINACDKAEVMYRYSEDVWLELERLIDQNTEEVNRRLAEAYWDDQKDNDKTVPYDVWHFNLEQAKEDERIPQ